MYRYKPQIPRLNFDSNGWVEVYCDPDRLPWKDLSWGRWGSGSDYNARHMFVDDWRLEHLWRRQEQGMAKVICQQIVTAADFTIEHDYPLPMAQYQVWRSRILSLYWQENEAVVVPVLQWGRPDTFPICVKGIKKGSVVAVRGPQRGTESAWLEGMNYMNRRIEPSLVLHFGNRIDYRGEILFFPLRPTRRKKS